MAKSKSSTEQPTTNKTRMVQSAMDELGNASPKDIQNYVKDHFSTDITTQMISSYKSNILKKTGGKVSMSGVSVPLRDVGILREMIERLGAKELQELIKVLSR